MRIEFGSFFPSNRAGLMAGFAVAALLAGAPALRAQDANTQTVNQQTTSQQLGKGTVTDTQKTTVDAQGKETTSASSDPHLQRSEKEAQDCQVRARCCDQGTPRPSSSGKRSSTR